jgi:hypothetical protein
VQGCARELQDDKSLEKEVRNRIPMHFDLHLKHMKGRNSTTEWREMAIRRPVEKGVGGCEEMKGGN